MAHGTQARAIQEAMQGEEAGGAIKDVEDSAAMAGPSWRDVVARQPSVEEGMTKVEKVR